MVRCERRRSTSAAVEGGESMMCLVKYDTLIDYWGDVMDALIGA